MVHTRRQSSRLRSTPQRLGRAVVSEDVASPTVAATPNMPSLEKVDEQPEAANPEQVATPKTSSDQAVSNVPKIAVHTPTSKTQIQPSGIEMHPAHHHLSTAKPLDEARWLGFLDMGAATEPVKKGASKIPITQATPTKSQQTTATTTFSTPEFKFRFRRPSLDLSPEAKKLMEESRKEAEKIRAQMSSNPERFGIERNEDIARRIATPTSKTSRFSAAHMAEFKKMDSIANHPSALRANRDRLQPAATAFKRSPSKAELDKQEKTDSKMPRTKSAMDLRKADCDGNTSPAKRVKQSKEDDASAARHVLENGEGSKPATQKSATAVRGPPRSLFHLTTPTKASLARSQSVKTLKKTSYIPTLARSPSAQALRTPSKPPASLMDNLRKASQSVSRLPSVKSILRSPVRHYSQDPVQIAAGTHMTSPPNLSKDLPDVPATAPVQKHVVFSESTLAKNGEDKEVRASSEVPQDASSEVKYPELPESSEVKYPELPAASPAHRGPKGPGDFTFRSDRTIKFGSGVKGPTIRHVRSSDASSSLPDPFTSSAKKRKVDVPSAITESEKENEEEDGSRPVKRAKMSTKATPKKAEAISKTPRRREAGRGALSQARLNLLAQPKRRVILGSFFDQCGLLMNVEEENTLALRAAKVARRHVRHGRKSGWRFWRCTGAAPSPPAVLETVATVASQLLSRVTQAIQQRDPAAPKPRVLDNVQRALHDFVRTYNLPFSSLLHDPAPSPPASPLDYFAAAARRYTADPTSLLVLLATLFAGILIGLFGLKRMSWGSRFGSWGGRFSPFGRGDPASTTVSDADFSYITSEDLANQKNQAATDGANHTTSSPAPSGRSNANGETDILVLKHKRVSYPVHFARGAIDAGELSVRSIRDAAARKMDVDDPRRIKLFFKGRQLKDDQQARAVGLRSDYESEIMCVVGEGVPSGSSSKADGGSYAHRGDDVNGADSGSESSDNGGDSTPGGGPRSKKSKGKRRRGGKKHSGKKGGRSESGTPEPGLAYVGGGAKPEFLGVPTTSAVPPRPSSSSSNGRPAPPQKLPQTPLDKLQELSSKFHTTLVPMCVQFMSNPPQETAKREFEHKRLTETVLAQVLLKLDAIETGGDENIRAKRKELVKECNNMLSRLDEALKH
ncbi:erythromycin esterase protein [Diplodia corticola]|uniref:Erythromycin esterase protein n=1 Tax=Diplodia corticola TaxID=236234 RepID=A0A1J9RUL2_9PEZI|nr:erythromycin esterase protein [Diplodia corticola]OJD36275.1 erythromycin esterase protein [Diplodia corticola]